MLRQKVAPTKFLKKSEKVIVDGVDHTDELNNLLELCAKNLKKFDKELIKKAFIWCLNAHKNKLRRSGEPFYTHPLAVATIVITEIPLDDISVASALLHDVTDNDEFYNIKAIYSEFGLTIGEIVEGISKIRHVESHRIQHFENYRKLLLSMFKDIRIILVKLADRLHNMRTIHYLPPERQMTLAIETMDIYAPFANRFGLGAIKGELEDLAFKVLNKPAYNQISQRLNQTREERIEYINNFIKPIEARLKADDLLQKNNVQFEITGRAKHIFSIYNKTFLRQKTIDELYDLFAIRIILDTEDIYFCFYVYGILSEIYKPVPGTFKNYISSPKKNGYQSLHVAVVGPNDKIVEVQIRTRQMHIISEKGVAAHFKYKRGLLPAQSVLESQNIEEWLDVVRDVFENPNDESSKDIIEKIKNNLFKDEIYVFTPAKEFRTLPKNATPIDFAYLIHTDLGNHCVGAKVNGKIVPLDMKLKSGDQVEIITSTNQKPSKDWLKFVVTTRAKNAIQKFFNEEERALIQVGKKIWINLQSVLGTKLSNADVDLLCKKLRFKGKDEFFSELAREELVLFQVLQIIQSDYHLDLSKCLENSADLYSSLLTSKKGKSNKVRLDLVKNFIFAECCYPVPGDKISVVVNNKDKSAVVHRYHCSKFRSILTEEFQNVSNVLWESLPKGTYRCKIKLVAEDNKEVLGKLTKYVSSLKDVQLNSIDLKREDNEIIGFVIFEVNNIIPISSIFTKLVSLEGIKLVERFME